MRSRNLLGLAVLFIGAITLSHFATDTHAVGYHNFFRRLYYLPIVLGSFAYGARGGVGLALAAAVSYAPHAFFAMHRDPAPTVDKALEIALFLVIGLLTGWLVDREREARRRLERSLQEREELETQLIRAGRLSALGELVAGVAHEIRNPLASISGSAQALATEFDEDHRKYPIVQIMNREIERLERVVKTFLDFARPSPPARARVDLRSLAEHAHDLLASAPERESVDFEVDGPNIWVEGDRDQLTQVLLNLGLNAVRAVGESEAPRVRFEVERRRIGESDWACVTVRDNGPGISEELVEQVFDPFFTTYDDGTGLGLSISNRIIEAHDGIIEVESMPNGTAFIVCLEEI